MLHFSYYPASEAGPCDETAHLGQASGPQTEDRPLPASGLAAAFPHDIVIFM